jgi:8-oxo-dGTP diphosphatase
LNQPTPVDKAFQVAYIVAYRMMRMYWRVRRPRTSGALVAIFNSDCLLLVKNSYVPYYSLPGGYLRRGETARDAARRELREEVNIDVSPEQLEAAVDSTQDWEGKRDHVNIFVLTLDTRPSVTIDNREVVHAGWYSPEDALKLNLFPPIRRLLEERFGARVKASS